MDEILGSREHWTLDMQVFKDTLFSSGLHVVNTVGDTFTWTNKRYHAPIFKHLDRMVSNSHWFQAFTESQFFNFMIDIPGFLDLVSRSWSLACSGSPIHQFNLKLKHTKLALRELNKNHGILQTNVQAFRSKLEDVHLALLSNPFDENLINTERSLINDLNMDLAQEECLLLQKAINKWMGHGALVHGQVQCAEVAVTYFQNFLGPTHQNIDIDISHVDSKMVTPDQASLLEAPVTDALIFDTIRKIKKNKAPGPDGVNVEFFMATWSLTGSSFCESVKHFFVSGFLPPDTILEELEESPIIEFPVMVKVSRKWNDYNPLNGFLEGVNLIFVDKSGQRMHGWVCSAVLEYFVGLHLKLSIYRVTIARLQTSSSTLVILKEFKNLKSPTRMQGFHLISLCIVMYKCISKILASRLKLILPSLVDIAQSTFIPVRSISDNILLAHELFHGYERENSTPKCALKIDLHKAFDSVHWDFILAVLRGVQIPEKVIKWISACIFSTRFSVKLSGVVHGFFKGTKGIRQGDPLSLYIFALCMNVLSCILNKVPEGFKFHWRCTEHLLSHLFFADDILFFAHGSKINTFSRWSGHYAIDGQIRHFSNVMPVLRYIRQTFLTYCNTNEIALLYM
ncbi:uncharacterized protein LOC141695827 [Apium graveolens]|uniref:uncharacterized protein LOC141695827 n=1 Tax=Apium graveolens TaxID=4045 RepID=UPI003D78CF64